mgnify:FL=1
MHFWFKKLVSLFFYPVPASLLVMTAGIVLLWLRKRETLGKSLVTAGIAILVFFSTPFLPNALLSMVEGQVSPCTDPLKTAEKNADSDTTWVVVLGQYYNPQEKYPYTLRTNRTLTKRLTEAVRIHKRLPNSKLLVSLAGCGTEEQKDAFADGIAELFTIDRKSIRIIYEARTTRDEIRLAKDVVQGEQCYLVSEALHLPRALTLCETYDLKAIPAPSEYLAPERACTTAATEVLYCLPNPTDLDHARRAIHECLGTAWAEFTGMLDESKE